MCCSDSVGGASAVLGSWCDWVASCSCASRCLPSRWSDVFTSNTCTSKHSHSPTFTQYATDTHLADSFPRQPGQAGTRKVKQIWILMKQEMMGSQWHQLDHMQIICTLLQTDKPRQHLIIQASTGRMLFLMPTPSQQH